MPDKLDELIAIPVSEYNHLLDCERELISLREQMIADRLNEIQMQMRQIEMSSWPCPPSAQV
jgi:hypothetical protein